VTIRDVQAALVDVLESSTYFDAVWKELPDSERCVLTAMAEAQAGSNVATSRSEINTKVSNQLPQAEIGQAWNFLKQRDMIDMNNDKVRLRVELVRQWVARAKQRINDT
jgi:hypothetical protein